MGLSLLILTAVLTSFLFFSRTGIAMANYHDAETQSRALLETFGRDVRQAEEVAWPDTTTLRLNVLGNTITYQYDATDETVTRTPAGGMTVVLAADVTHFEFRPYNVEGAPVPFTAGSLSAAETATKMIQLSLELTKRIPTGSDATTSLVSSRYMLRNKTTS